MKTLENTIIQHKKYFLEVAYNITKCHNDADEVFQESCLKAIKSWEKFKKESCVKTWLTTIVKNTALNKIRSKKVLLDIDNDEECEEPASSIDTVREVALAELRMHIDLAMDKLSEAHHKAITLVDLNGIGQEAAAIECNCSPATLRSRLFYARKMIAENLKARGLNKTSLFCV